ncbi:MAG: response regulator [Magnetospirillum sp.]|nr:response regulator [Magnetospirillum sp.]
MALRSLSVLVAEEDPADQTLLARLLTGMGHTATVTGNGAEALELAAMRRFDAVLMGVALPVMDGETATRLIRKLPGENAAVPVVALTTQGTAEDHRHHLSAGMDAVLVKPVDALRLAEFLEQVVPAAAPSAPAAETELPILDGSYLDDLRQWVGDATVLTLLASAPASFNDEMAAIRAAWSRRDPQSMRENAHRLKGAAGSVGCRRLAELAQTLQKMRDEEILAPTRLDELAGEVEAAIAAALGWQPAEPVN